MAVTNWVGGDSGGTTDWTIAANWDNGVPGSGDDAVIGNVTHDPTIPDGTDPTLGSIQVTTGGQLTAGNNVITLDDVNGSGFAFYLNGTGAFVKGTSTITFTDSSNQYIAINTSNANRTFYNVTVNKTGSGDVYIYQSRDGSSNEPLVISNNLTISARGLSTANDASSPSTYFDLTVEGNCTVAGGTLEGNASSGATVRLKNLTVSSGTYSATGGETIITGETGAGRAVDIVGTFTHNSGTLSIQTPADTLLRWPSSSEAYHLRINDSDCIARPTGDNKPLIAGNLTITAGEFNTLEGGQNHALTVEGGVSGAGTLTTNASEVSLGYLIMSGTYNATTHANGTILTDRSGPSAQLLMDVGDIVHNDGLFVFKGSPGGSSYCALNGASDATNGLYNVKIDASSRTVNISTYNLTIHNDLTVEAGTFNTSSSDYTLTVGGEMHSKGTFTSNSSTVTVRNLVIEGGTFNSPDGSGMLNITGEGDSGYGDGYAFRRVSGAFVDNTGTVTFKTPSTTSIRMGTAAQDFYNVIFNESSAGGIFYVNDEGFTVTNDCTITAGDFDTTLGTATPLIDIQGTLTIASGHTFGGITQTQTSAISLGALTVSGTFKATSGTTTCKGAVNVASGGTFTHNDGTFLWENTTGDSITGFGAGAPVFYNLEISSSTTNDIFPQWDFTVRNVFDTNGQQIWIHPNSRDVTITMGFSDATAVSAGATTAGLKTGGYINSTLKSYQNHLNDIKLYGASQLYPAQLADAWLTFAHTSQADCTWYIKNFNVQSAFNTTYTAKAGSNAIIILDGDCEFAAVTVTGGDTFDINGQRVEIGGLLSTSTGTITATDSLIFLTAKSGGFSTRVFNISTFSSAGSTIVVDHDSPLMQIQSDESFNNLMFRGSGNVTDNDVTATGTTWFAGEDYDNSTRNQDYSLGNITIPTGGALSAGSGEFTCSGDLTMSGGLLGASCYNCDSSNDYYANTSSINFRSDSARDYTVEFWMKPDSVTNAETDRLVHSDQRFAIWKYEDDIVFAPNYDVSFTASAVLTAGKWTHVACTWDTSENALEIFIDGKLVKTGTDTTTDKTGAAAIYLGRKDDTSQEFDGYLDEVRLWEDVRTVGQIRADMFQGGTLADSGDLFARWSLDEGTGTTGASTVNTPANDLTVVAGGWAGAGTFTYGTSTLVMAKSGTQNINFLHGDDVYHLTVNDGSTTELVCLDDGGGTLDIYGNLTVNEKLRSASVGSTNSNIRMREARTITVGADVKTTALADLYRIMLHQSGGIIDVPELTTKRIFVSNGGTEAIGRATGDVTLTEELEVSTGNTFNANGNTITANLVDLNGTATLNLQNSSTLTLSSASGLTSESGVTLLAGGGGVTISGSSAATTFESQNDFKVVGTVENLNVTNEELSVTGKVINCSGEIIQQHQSVDAAQQLDFDSAEDRDIMLGRDLDKNTELVG